MLESHIQFAWHVGVEDSEPVLPFSLEAIR
jgi:hypothetical protein